MTDISLKMQKSVTSVKESLLKIKKVRDHCHITGEFRGAAHQSCNLNVRTSLKIPVFLHNGSGYDFKHFIRKLHKNDKNLRIISQTEEKHFSITVRVEGTNIQRLTQIPVEVNR
jgi:hypothetical protein